MRLNQFQNRDELNNHLDKLMAALQNESRDVALKHLDQEQMQAEKCNFIDYLLHRAAKTGNEAVVAHILASPLADTALPEQSLYKAIETAATHGHLKLISYFWNDPKTRSILAGVESSAMRNTAFLTAVKQGHLELVDFFLSKAIELKDDTLPKNDGLLLATEMGHTPIATLLLQKGADAIGWAMGTALKYKQTEMISLLVRAPNLSAASKNDFVKTLAGHPEYTESLSLLLQDPDIALNTKTAALLVAVKNNHLAAVRLLVEAGGSVINNHYENALVKASAFGYTDIVQYLLEVIHTAQQDPNNRHRHWTVWIKSMALVDAVFYKQETTIQLLIKEEDIALNTYEQAVRQAIRSEIDSGGDFKLVAILYIGYAKRKGIDLHKALFAESVDNLTDQALLNALVDVRNGTDFQTSLLLETQQVALKDAVKAELQLKIRERRFSLLLTAASLLEYPQDQDNEMKNMDESLKISQTQPFILSQATTPTASIQPNEPSQPTNQEIANALPAFATYKSKASVEPANANDRTSAQLKKDKSLQPD